MVDLFSVPIFLVTFREALETAIIVSVLLAFLKQTLSRANRTVYKQLVRQVWFGTLAGLVVTLIISGTLIGVFYGFGLDKWGGNELNYEGAFSLLASLIITFVGFALLRIGKMQDKWKAKIELSFSQRARRRTTKRGAIRRWMGNYSMFILPFVTVLREGIEAVIFIGGVSFSAPATSVPIAVIVGLTLGAGVGWAIYKGGSHTKLKLFLVISTCFLYLVAAGLFSRAVWAFEQQVWQEALGSGEIAELGAGPGTYDIDKSVWHVNCCSPFVGGGSGWGFLNAILGWNNSATYGSVLSYNLYWVAVITAFLVMRFKEVKGHWPIIEKPKLTEEHLGRREDGFVSTGGPRGEALGVEGNQGPYVEIDEAASKTV
ncbi:putative plasma membrane iron permease [Triangularia verruculosa]|uniref:Plasma membrane iron permease n=1 Tax=Triangularia verruculosa TaxID=2587418 RepID=A0AAN6XS90_9PEZI|nr:putative plasma membrane iron permease [Triangularia verruculosa]